MKDQPASVDEQPPVEESANDHPFGPREVPALRPSEEKWQPFQMVSLKGWGVVVMVVSLGLLAFREHRWIPFLTIVGCSTGFFMLALGRRKRW